jgi:hypothetical protein
MKVIFKAKYTKEEKSLSPLYDIKFVEHVETDSTIDDMILIFKSYLIAMSYPVDLVNAITLSYTDEE